MINRDSVDLELSSSQYASIADASQTGLDITGTITIEAWINLEQLPSTAGTGFQICSKFNTTGNQRSFQFLVDTANKLAWDFSEDGTGTDLSQYTMDETFTSTATWIHIAVTCTPSTNTVVFYKNAVVKANTASVQNAIAIFNSTAAFAVGARVGAPDSYFDGKINNLRMYNDIRTATEIANNYQKVITSTGVENLVDSWYYTDSHNSASGLNNLTASGSPTFSTDVPFVGSPNGAFLPFL